MASLTVQITGCLNHRRHAKEKDSDRTLIRVPLWSEWRDLNPRHLGPKPSALPAALHPDFSYFFVFFNQALCLYPRETRYSRPRSAYTIRKPRKARRRLVVQLRYTRISSEETRAIPFPQFAKELRKLHIRSFLLPLPIKPASLGFDRVPGFRNTSCSEKLNYYISPGKQKQAEKCR